MRSWLVFGAALVVLSSCIGDDPPPVSAVTPSADAAAGEAAGEGEGGTGSDGGANEAPVEAGTDADADGGARPPPGTAAWLRQANERSANLSLEAVAVASRGGRRLFARAVPTGGVDPLALVRVEWLSAAGSVTRTSTFESPSPIGPSGAALDGDGNAFVSIVFRGSVTGPGLATAIQPAVSDANATVSECLVARLDGATGQVVWRRTFAVSASATNLSFHRLSCKVNELSEGQVLVSGTFTSAAVRALGATTSTAFSRHSNSAGPGAPTDGFLATLDTANGNVAYMQSIASTQTAAGADVLSAVRASATRILFAGRTDATSVTLSTAASPVVINRPGTVHGTAAIYGVIDTATAVNSSGEAWEITPTATPAVGYAPSAQIFSIGRNAAATVLTGVALSEQAASLSITGVAAAQPLAANAHTRFVVAIPTSGARQALSHAANAIQFYVGRTAAAADGTLILSATHGTALDLGGSCQLATPSETRSYIALFEGGDLSKCQLLRSYPRFEAFSLSTTDGPSFVLAGTTTRALDFGPSAQAPAPPGPRSFATEIAH
jgi:hypothetical protein